MSASYAYCRSSGNLSTLDSYNKNDAELGHSYTSRKLNMSIWRSTVPDPDQPADDIDGRYF